MYTLCMIYWLYTNISSDTKKDYICIDDGRKAFFVEKQIYICLYMYLIHMYNIVHISMDNTSCMYL